MSSANFEPRLNAVEVDMSELKRSISDLRSTVSTLADIVSLHEQQHKALRAETDRRFEATRQSVEASRIQADADRALMLQLIQAIAQGGNGSIQT
ncbi:MAG TPA: hypothetical protein V6C84_27285 [Coleofasciculaceae cyanobacterium]|jgi:hypothetical protein